jgi:hypothetical protein
MTRLAILLVVVAAVVPATTAQAATTSKQSRQSGGTLLISKGGTTSCRMAMATARVAARRHYAPVIYVVEPITYRVYKMRRVEFINLPDQRSAMYKARGPHGTHIIVSIMWYS